MNFQERQRKFETSMVFVRSMLQKGIITQKDFEKCQTKLAKKYNLSLFSL